MKKKLLLALLTLAVACAMVLCISAETPKVIQPGDVNGDGEINAVDMVLLSQYIAGWEVILGGDSHTVVIDAAVPATCTKTGLTEGKHCSDCGMILVKQRVVPMADHDYEDTVVQPTTKADGYTLHKCKVCGDEYKDNFVPAIDSNGLAVEVDTESMTCVIMGIGDCLDKDINIPSKISDYTVVGIADKAFSEQTQITSITIPNTVKTLGQRAFYGCTGLTEFTVPASVTSVGHQVFYKCDNLTTVYYNSDFSPSKDEVFLNTDSIKTVIFGGTVVPANICCNSNIENVTISDGIIGIGSQAFQGSTGLTDITIPSSVKWLDFGAFLLCTGLTDIVIPEGVERVYSSAFEGCTGLKSVTIPKSVIGIGACAFFDCNNLKKIYISDLESWLKMSLGNGSANPLQPSMGELYINNTLATDIIIPNSITTIGEYAFVNCSSLTNVTIPNRVTSIGNSAFYYCENLASVNIPDSVNTIGQSAFEGCQKLKKVEIPDSVRSIGSSAFRACHDLKSIIIPDSVTNISSYTFEHCTNLMNIVIPNSITGISFYAFYGCTNLYAIYYGGTEESWNKITIGFNNAPLTSAIRYYYSATQPTESGNYWHYVDGKPTPW